MEYPSVTQVLSPFAQYANIPPEVLKRAVSRGNYVHAAAVGIAMKLFIPPPPPEYAGYIRSLEWWFTHFVDEVLLVEEEIVDPVLGYMGHPDLVVVSRVLGGVILVDHKTPLQLHRTWASQMAGYRRLVEVPRGIPVDRLGSLRLSKDGKPPRFQDYTNDPAAFAAFYAALQAWKFFNS